MGMGARVAGVVAVVTGVVVGVVALAGAPAAADDGATPLKVSSAAAYDKHEPVRLLFTVTNASSAPCGIPTLPDGAAQVVAVTRDGQVLEPTLATSYYEDGLASALIHSLVTVAPGKTGQVTLMSTAVDDGTGPDSAVLRSVTMTADGIPLDAQWPIGAPGRYEVTAAYAAPAVAGACAGVAANQTVTFTIGGSGGGGRLGGVAWWWWAAGAAIVVLLVVVAVMLLRRRRPGASAAVLMLAALVVVGAQAQPARASYTINPDGGNGSYDDFTQQVENCLGRFALAGDPAGVLKRLKDPKTPRVTIVPSKGGSVTGATPKSKNGKGSSTVAWNPVNTEPFDDGVARDPCSSLYHELSHANDISKGTVPEGMCGNTGIRTAEVKATFDENKYRATQQNKDQRKQYDGKDLPKSLDECKQPKKPKTPQKGPVRLCENSNECGKTNGDPHLTTFDQAYYDFQAVGEFVAVRSTSGDPLEIQVRQAPLGTSRSIAVNTAVGVRVGPATVSLTIVGGVTEVRIDGAVVVLPRGEKALTGGGALNRRESDISQADGYDVRFPDGSEAAIDQIGSYGYRLMVKLAKSRAGAVEGLLGNFDGDPSNDIAPAGGAVITQPAAFDKLYPGYADSWRVKNPLFTYAKGQSTATFTDRSFPDKPALVSDLDADRRAQAEETCRLAGVTDAWQLAECVFDVGVTGRPEFAVGSAATEQVAPPTTAPIAATPIASGTLAAGSDQRLTFAGLAGQAVFVDISGPGIGDQCSPYQLLDPSGNVIATACNINGSGYIDRIVLTADGQYALRNDARDSNGAKATMRVYRAEDVHATITPNGDAVTATVAQPGALALYDFTGRAGQRVFVDVPHSSLGDQCSPLELRNEAGQILTSGCVINGVGYIDGFVLPATGRYTVVVNPDARTTGTTGLRLYAADDQVAPITAGTPVTATITQPGLVVRYTFAATAGQSVSVDASAGTLPDQCSPLELRDPGGNIVTTGCVINGKGEIKATTLATTGTYSLVVDAGGDTTGVVTLLLRG